MTETALACRYFTSYSGIKLPLKLVGELDAADMRNRNPFSAAASTVPAN